jgi:hypothetical protein
MTKSSNHKRPNKTLARLHEREAFAMRARGATLQTIADALGLSREGVRKVLERVDVRELKALAEEYRVLKVQQNSQLETLIEEAFGGWFKSKEPGNRIRQTTNEGGEVTVTEVVERVGDVAFMDRIRGALADQRKLWGLDVAEAQQERYFTVAKVVQDMADRGRRYEEQTAIEGEAAPDPPPSTAPTFPTGAT